MYDGFDRHSLTEGLRAVVRRSRLAGIGPIVIRIVGGAALQLQYFERETTGDIDASLNPEGPLREIVADVANDYGWPDDWLNDRVARAGYIPVPGHPIAWVTLFEDDQALVQVAPADVLLAMKLRAFDERRTRDLQDVLELMSMTGAISVAAVDDALTRYFPGTSLSTEAIDVLAFHLGRGLPPPPAPLADLGWN